MKKNYLVIIFFLAIGILPLSGNVIYGHKKSIIYQSINELKVEVDKKDASTQDAADGYIKIQITGGTGNYSITCFSPFDLLPSKTQADKLFLQNLKSGSYLFVIKDNSGNTTTQEVKIG